MTSRQTNIATAIAFLAAIGTSASAQETSYPEKCKSMSGDMASRHMQMMNSAGMKMKDFHKEYMEGMQKTMPLMMGGMMNDDADMAFVCGMIAHHMGAIEMSETELKHGGDEQAKQVAQKIIDAQKKEIEDMSKWVEAHAK